MIQAVREANAARAACDNESMASLLSYPAGRARGAPLRFDEKARG
jgi:hypothetical protein